MWKLASAFSETCYVRISKLVLTCTEPKGVRDSDKGRKPGDLNTNGAKPLIHANISKALHDVMLCSHAILMGVAKLNRPFERFNES